MGIRVLRKEEKTPKNPEEVLIYIQEEEKRKMKQKKRNKSRV